MKYCRFLTVLLIFLCVSSVGNCSQTNSSPLSSQGKYSMKLNLQDKNSVADKANRNPSVLSGPSSGLTDDPFVNSAINSMGSMIQGMTNGSYGGAEQQRQQMEFSQW